MLSFAALCVACVMEPDDSEFVVDDVDREVPGRPSPTDDGPPERCESELTGAVNHCGADGTAYYAHPFQSIAGTVEDGEVPLLDIKDDPHGRRYVMMTHAEVPEEGGRLRTSTGIVGAEQGPIDEEIRSIIAMHEHEAFGDLRLERVAPGLRAALDKAQPADGIEVGIVLPSDGIATVDERVWRSIALGEVDTVVDAREVERRVQQERAQQTRQRVDRVAEAVVEVGGKVTYRCERSTCLDATLTPHMIEALASDERIAVMDIKVASEDETNSMNGKGYKFIYQTEGMLNAGYDGENSGGPWDIHGAVAENDGYMVTHPALKESSAVPTRIAGKYNCMSGSCLSVSSWPVAERDNHALEMAALQVGDITDGQDPAISGFNNRDRRSFGAREAKIYLYEFDTAKMSAGLDHVPGNLFKPELVSFSQGSNDPDPGCNGWSIYDWYADQLFENSVLFMKSAGNTNGSVSDCVISTPGAASSAFTVSKYANGSTFDDWCDARSPAIDFGSAWGAAPGWPEGRGRTIVDIMATEHEGVASGTTVATYDTSDGGVGGTSAATAATAGAALQFIDMYKNNYDNFIDSPGVLFAWMLNMGDRTVWTGSEAVRNYDPITGSGRLRMRMLNPEGMDAPWGMWNISTCVDDGQTVTIDLGSVQGDADSLRATAYWYDPTFKLGAAHDNIDMFLYDGNTLLRSSADANDNKERIFFRDIGGKDAKLKLVGSNVRQDSVGCGSDSMRVYVSVMLEDDDRDDGNGPTYNANTCRGVERL